MARTIARRSPHSFAPQRLLPALALLFVGVLAACSDATTEAPQSPLAGLTEGAATDSTGSAAPTQGPEGPGYFRGTILGPSVPGAGNDSLETAPRVSGAVVTAFPVISGFGPSIVLGDAAASVTTGADGKFTLPTLPGGIYAVTINPPESGPYGGVWVAATAHGGSHEFPWWVVLWAK